LRRWPGAPEKPFPAEMAPALYNAGGFAHNLFFPERHNGEIVWRREGLRMRVGRGRTLVVTVLFTLGAAKARAQQPAAPEIQGTDQSQTAAQIPGGLKVADAPKPALWRRRVEPAPVSTAAPQASAPQTTHRFWDRTNDLWFAGVGAARALDYASTLNLRRRGIDEIFLTNSIVDNHPLFGGIEAAATGASIGASYLFHRTGHHRLERWTSIVHFGVATGGAARNYALKTPHKN
jgi:hypothetical protein